MMLLPLTLNFNFSSFKAAFDISMIKLVETLSGLFLVNQYEK